MAAADLFSLKGRVALVTGASSGLGERFAEVLAEAGAAVALVALRHELLEEVRARIAAAGSRTIAVVADVRDRAAMMRAFDQAEAELGTVDILINNAGVAHAGRIVRLAETEWRRVLDTNLDAALYWSQEAARRLMAAQKGGAIVNISSILGFGVSSGVAAYAVSKAGIIQLTRALGFELASRGIRVNAIAPGWIVTNINRDYLAGERGAAILQDIPLGRFGETRDLDGTLLLLCSDAGRFITGTTIVVDGGQVIGMRG
jgi:NAD(P)-dependent dehydrogenase (short-subunit alcohol dehydrogenase family)